MMKDGNVYHWRWKDDERHNCGEWSWYHCKSRIAISRDGQLYDTYWGDGSGRLERSEIRTKLKGNINEMQEISRWDVECYRRKDIVDMKHPNSSRAKVYAKVGATRDAKAMLARIDYMIEESERTIRSAEDKIGRLKENITAVESGRLDEVMF